MHPRSATLTLTAACLMAAAVAPASSAPPGGIDFNRDVRPILSDKCFQCHGPDAEARKADLRLDDRKAATADLGGYAAIMPGRADDSALIARIVHTDPEEQMPPPKTKKTLTSREIEVLKRWVNEGAPYAEHWAFLPIKSPTPPASQSGWARNEIDRFVEARLAAEGIAPSPEADARTLIRRLSLDLVGLLPAPGEVERFVTAFKSDKDAAVGNLVDELLASDHYGERWGRHWLDQARYADSNGYTIDGERAMWPYRDWVIRAINEDVPFDRFTIEQIAGDLLPHPAKSQLIASGFHRNTLINEEGGTDDEQFRNEEAVDRVNTTGAVWMGLTLGCAQCHSHKFDPVSQKEYFQLFAFFNQGEDVNNAGPTVEVSEGEIFLDATDPALTAALAKAQAELAELDRTAAKRQRDWETKLLASRSEEGAAARWSTLAPQRFSATEGARLEKLADDSILAAESGPRETYSVAFAPAAGAVAAVRLRVLTHESLPKTGPGLAANGNFVLTRVEIRHGGEAVAIAGAQHDHAQPDFSAEFLIDDDSETGWAINVGKGSAAGIKMNAPHEAHFILADPLPADGRPIEVILHHEKNDNYNIGRFAIDVSPAAPATLAEEKLFATVALEPAKRSAEEKKFLTGEFGKADAERRRAAGAVSAAKKALGLGPAAKAMVMRDRTEPRETFVHLRGDFLRPDLETGRLTPGVPAILPALAKGDETPDRLDLARWLVRPDHPLTPRVTVNRVWMRYFGKGLVETENDFGIQGAFPTHPELLDWLARKFVDDGWSMKRLHKLIVTSATYRQSSMARPELEEIDPLNHLLARQNRLRVDAEIVRDAALSASGALSPVIGGPSVMPPQPDGVYAFTQRKVNWVTAEGPNRFRRALYTKFFRTAPYPLLTTFDAPDFQSVCTGRVRSNTPLQALTMANDEAVFELARELGARFMRESGGGSEGDRERIRTAYRLCFSRPPSESELAAVAEFQERQEARFAADGNGAEEVAPDDYPEETFSVAEAASWTAVARVLMNTDEFITRE